MDPISSWSTSLREVQSADQRLAPVPSLHGGPPVHAGWQLDHLHGVSRFESSCPDRPRHRGKEHDHARPRRGPGGPGRMVRERCLSLVPRRHPDRSGGRHS